jgi:hypothetical protein
MTYPIDKGIPLEKMKTSKTRKSKYPFDELEVEDSFFIAATEDKPQPWKSFGPQVNWAKKRFAPKTFAIHKHESEEYGLGARIWRKS